MENCLNLVVPDNSGKPAEAWLVHPDLPGWMVVLLVDRFGQVESLTIKPVVTMGNGLQRDDQTAGPTPHGGVTTRLLRRIQLGVLLSWVKADVAAIGESLAQFPRDGMLGSMLSATQDFTSRPGRAGRDDYDYAVMADRYVALLNSGHLNAAAALAGQLHLSPSQVRNVLYEARRRDLLTKSPPGKAGGQLTDKARRLLEGAKHGER